MSGGDNEQQRKRRAPWEWDCKPRTKTKDGGEFIWGKHYGQRDIADEVEKPPDCFKLGRYIEFSGHLTEQQITQRKVALTRSTRARRAELQQSGENYPPHSVVSGRSQEGLMRHQERRFVVSRAKPENVEREQQRRLEKREQYEQHCKEEASSWRIPYEDYRRLLPLARQKGFAKGGFGVVSYMQKYEPDLNAQRKSSFQPAAAAASEEKEEGELTDEERGNPEEEHEHDQSEDNWSRRGGRDERHRRDNRDARNFRKGRKDKHFLAPPGTSEYERQKIQSENPNLIVLAHPMLTNEQHEQLAEKYAEFTDCDEARVKELRDRSGSRYERTKRRRLDEDSAHSFEEGASAQAENRTEHEQEIQPDSDVEYGVGSDDWSNEDWDEQQQQQQQEEFGEVAPVPSISPRFLELLKERAHSPAGLLCRDLLKANIQLGGKEGKNGASVQCKELYRVVSVAACYHRSSGLEPVRLFMEQHMDTFILDRKSDTVSLHPDCDVRRRVITEDRRQFFGIEVIDIRQVNRARALVEELIQERSDLGIDTEGYCYKREVCEGMSKYIRERLMTQLGEPRVVNSPDDSDLSEDEEQHLPQQGQQQQTQHFYPEDEEETRRLNELQEKLYSQDDPLVAFHKRVTQRKEAEGWTPVDWNRPDDMPARSGHTDGAPPEIIAERRRDSSQIVSNKKTINKRNKERARRIFAGHEPMPKPGSRVYVHEVGTRLFTVYSAHSYRRKSVYVFYLEHGREYEQFRSFQLDKLLTSRDVRKFFVGGDADMAVLESIYDIKPRNHTEVQAMAADLLHKVTCGPEEKREKLNCIWSGNTLGVACTNFEPKFKSIAELLTERRGYGNLFDDVGGLKTQQAQNALLYAATDPYLVLKSARKIEDSLNTIRASEN